MSIGWTVHYDYDYDDDDDYYYDDDDPVKFVCDIVI